MLPERKSLSERHSIHVRYLGIITAFLAALALIILAFSLLEANVTSEQDVGSGRVAGKIGADHSLNPAENPDDEVDFVIYMESQVDLDSSSLPPEKRERRRTIVKLLQELASSSQGSVLARLEQFAQEGSVSSFSSLWIANAIRVSGDSDIIAIIEQIPGVDRVVLDEPRQFIVDAEPLMGSAPEDATWGVKRTRAPHAWHGFGIDGAGATIAIMDTGVDWLHEALSENYRGITAGGDPDHLSNWFDAVDGAPAPFDPHGHGTHVAGTAVGEFGLGVAPGASWMAVRVLDDNGFGTIGGIHEGFQWLLAPNGDPSIAPDIVNGSWGSISNLLDFLPDVTALQAAGIIPIFAAGNDGPGEGTVHTPAAYPQTIAVGASDDIDAAAWFSSRGPTNLTEEVKPTLAAPGTYVLSAVAGGGYGYRDGTSMATPHVSGAAALLLAADPTLSPSEVTSILTSTTAAENPVPSNSIGWGRLDIYRAISNAIGDASLEIHVTGDGSPLASTAITITTPTGAALPYRSADNGRLVAFLSPGLYRIDIRAFGYNSFSMTQIAVSPGQTTIVDAPLVGQPAGTAVGTVTSQIDGSPVQALIRVKGTPAVVNTNQAGEYSLPLPEGSYELIASANGHRLGRSSVEITAGTFTHRDFFLQEAPTTLLVDSGQWYFRSQAFYYKQALEENNYNHDLLTIRDPFLDVPDAADLSDYDVVLWSAPGDSPEQIGAGSVISTYLSQGGQLFISGQNVGKYEDLLLPPESWWRNLLYAQHLGKTDPSQEFRGNDRSIFASSVITLNGEDSAGNQEAIDSVGIHPGTLTDAAFSALDGSIVGLQAGACEPYDIIYLGFGLEGVSGGERRKDIISRSFNFFERPVSEVGFQFEPETFESIVVPGHRITVTIDAINLSELFTDTFQLSVAGNEWPVSIRSENLTLGSCRSHPLTFTVEIPLSAPKDTVEEFKLVATSVHDPSFTASMEMRLKTPGHILLVDDDRWYDQQAVYRSALELNDFDYDYWETDGSLAGGGGPPGPLLNAYDVVIWYTGYDWYAPVTELEAALLVSYLDQGGRLFLSSQDYLDYHGEDDLTQNYLGIQSHQESVTPTIILGNHGPAFLEVLTLPLNLNFGPYQNFGDGIVPSEIATPSIWHDGGMPAGVAAAAGGWRTIFWSIPFETIPAEKQAEVMNRIVGWLSDLGDSTLTASPQTVALQDEITPQVTYSITLQPVDGAVSSMVRVTNTIPFELQIDQGSIAGGAQYDPLTRELTWYGQLADGDSHLIRYQAEIQDNASPGTLIENPVSIFYDSHNLQFERMIPVWLDAPDLSGSRLYPPIQSADPADIITYHLEIDNDLSQTTFAAATVYLPPNLRPDGRSLAASSGTISTDGRLIEWQGQLSAYGTIGITFAVTTPLTVRELNIPLIASIEDGIVNLVIRDASARINPFRSYLPEVTGGSRASKG